MRQLLPILLCLAAGCQTTAPALTVVGSAYVESERPEGKAVAKVEVIYKPSPARAEDRRELPIVRPCLLPPEGNTQFVHCEAPDSGHDIR